MMSEKQFYVYLYRDPRTLEIRYVGKGVGLRVEGPLRSASRKKPTHNPDLIKWINQLQRKGMEPVVEFLQCDTEAEALAVEGALISAHWGTGQLFNRVRGHHARFSPLGLPYPLRDRRYLPPVGRQDIADLGGALVVYVGGKDFTKDFTNDVRKGTKPRASLTADEVHARISRWWQIGRYKNEWEEERFGPRILMGVTGPPTQRTIWGSMKIDHKRWNESVYSPPGLWTVPTVGDSKEEPPVDFEKLRGRVIRSSEFGPVKRGRKRQFGGIRSQFFDIIPPATR